MEQVTNQISVADGDPKRQALHEALDLLDAEHGPTGKEAEQWASRSRRAATLNIENTNQSVFS